MIRNFICEQCGNPFENASRKKLRFCSHKCFAQSRVNSHVEQRACANCGKDYEVLVRPSDARPYKYCSYECMHLGRRLKAAQCPVCGKEYKPRFNHAHGKTQRQQYCSNACRSAARVGTGVGLMSKTSPVMLDAIRKHYTEDGTEQLAKMFGKSRGYIKQLANGMGLRLTPDARKRIIYAASAKSVSGALNHMWKAA